MVAPASRILRSASCAADEELVSMAFQIGRQGTLDEWAAQPQLDKTHWLVRLANSLPWEQIAETLRQCYSLKGRLAKQVRLVVGLLLIKHLYDLGDRVVVDGVHENLYWQYFCGVTLPRALEPEEEDDDDTPRPSPRKLLHHTVLTKFRRRVGPEGLERIEGILHEQMRKLGLVKGKTILVDTTAQSKDIQYPTETGLLDRGRKMIVRLVQQVGELGVKVKAGFRTFKRVAKRAVLFAAKLGKGQLDRVKEANAKLSAMARHVIRRASALIPQIRARATRALRSGVTVLANKLTRRASQIQETIRLTERVIVQNVARFAGEILRPEDKVLSIHEPHVVALSKGKRNKPTEFGTKVVLAMEPSGVIVAHKVYAENVADVKTIKPMIDAVEVKNGKPPEELGADRGMHHPKKDRERVGTARVRRVSIPTQGKTRAENADDPWFRRLQRKRAGIEATIGHLKTDHRMERSRYKGLEGDRINVSLASIAWNLKKIVRKMTNSGSRKTKTAAMAGALG
jgi:IS5 family transposase